MGLDMYLHRVPKVASLEELRQLETRLSKAYYAGTLESELETIQKEKGFKNPIKYEEDEHIHTEAEYKKYNQEYHNPKIRLQIEVGYWRKFNALHSWFVNTFQEGEDNCQLSMVNPQVLKDLFEKLCNISKENAEDILPTQTGFFFGGTEYDTYYFERVEELKQFLIGLFEDNDFQETTLTYQASW